MKLEVEEETTLARSNQTKSTHTITPYPNIDPVIASLIMDNDEHCLQNETDGYYTYGYTYHVLLYWTQTLIDSGLKLESDPNGYHAYTYAYDSCIQNEPMSQPINKMVCIV